MSQPLKDDVSAEQFSASVVALQKGMALFKKERDLLYVALEEVVDTGLIDAVKINKLLSMKSIKDVERA